jgi:hypothetical protein
VIHKINIGYECPICGFKTMSEITNQYAYQNFPCFKCSHYDEDSDYYIVYMEPQEVIQVIRSEITSEEPLHFIPSRLIYPSHGDTYDVNEHCEICNKCEDCEHYVEDEMKYKSCSLDYNQICVKTSECCQSVNHNKLKFLAQNHFSYEEIWSLDATISQFIIPRLQFFKDNISSFPSCLTFEKWKKILRYMIVFFKTRRSDVDSFFFYRKCNKFSEMKYNVYRKGKYYFYKYFENLWD